MAYTPTTWNSGDTVTAAKLNKLENGVASSLDKVVTEITYSELRDLVDDGGLIPGMFYRITDYVTIINGTYDVSSIAGMDAYVHYARSAEHPFDLIVQAIDDSNLDEHAVATTHEGNSYFNENRLEQWDIHYTIFNDPTKYAWADGANGKGVITYMRDEFGNEAGYDFKNIQILAYALKMADPEAQADSLCYEANDQPNRYGSVYGVFQAISGYLSSGEYSTPFMDHDFAVSGNILTSIAYPTADETYLTAFNADWYYTFDHYENGNHYDYSLNLGGIAFCFNNKIAECVDALASYTGSDVVPMGINGSIFHNDYTMSCANELGSNAFLNIFGCNSYGNKIGVASFANIFGDECYLNTIDNQCYENMFCSSCDDNILGASCGGNRFGEGCFHNTFGKHCGDNVLGAGCSLNNFGDSCVGNSLGYYCDSNTFSFRCTGNNLMQNCGGNFFGGGCFDSTFDNSCADNVLLGSNKGSSFGIGCKFNLLMQGTKDIGLGDSCERNVFYQGCSHIKFWHNICDVEFGQGCTYDKVDSSVQNVKVASETSYVYLVNNSNTTAYNYVIHSGVHGSGELNLLTITLASHSNFETHVAINSHGEIKTWNPADLVT